VTLSCGHILCIGLYICDGLVLCDVLSIGLCDICDGLVICIDAILIFVNYIFIVITACNVPAFIYIIVVFILKNREKRKKMCQLCRVLMQKHSAKWPSHVSKTSTLPSAKVLALDKDLKVCRVPGPSTRQSDHVAGPWVAILPSAYR